MLHSPQNLSLAFGQSRRHEIARRALDRVGAAVGGCRSAVSMRSVELHRKTVRYGGALLAVALAVALPSIVSAQQNEQPAAAERAFDRDFGTSVLEAGFTFVEGKYHRPVVMRDFSLAAVRGLTSIDRNLVVEGANGRVSVSYLGNDVGEFDMPVDNDPRAWSELVVNIVDALQSDVRRFGQASAEELFEALFDGATTTLDRASRYNSAAEATAARANRQGFGGVGIEIAVGFREVRIVSIVPDSPAERIGISVGDRLTHVGGETVAGLTDVEIQNLLRGPLETAIDVTLRRRDASTEILSVTRERIVPPTVTYSAADSIGEIKIDRFNRGTARDVQRSYEHMVLEHGRALDGLILDLRFNPGGLLLQSTEVADLFIVGGPISQSVGRVPESSARFLANDTDITDGVPIVVLVNARSASAAEVLAAALQDRGRAVVVGSNSFGKGSVQSIYPLPNGGDIVMTWSLLQAPSGYFYDGLGVIPNLCTSNRGGVEIAGGVSLVPPSTEVVMGEFLSGEPAAFRSLIADWRAISDVDDDDRKLQLRRNCSPVSGDHFLDLEIARRLIKSPNVFQQALRLTSTQPVAGDDILVVGEDEPPLVLTQQLANLLANDHDLDGDQVTITQINGSSELIGSPIDLESGATLKIRADGAVELDLSKLSRNLAAGETLSDQLTYEIADLDGGISSAKIVVSIEGRNDAPEANSDAGSVDEDSVLTVTALRGLLANDADADGTKLAIASINDQVELVGEAFELSSGARLVVQEDGGYTYDPRGKFDHLPPNSKHRDDFTYTVVDGDGGQTVGSVSIEVTGNNDHPVANDDELLVNEDSGLRLSANFGLLSNDVDPDGQPLEIIAVNGDAASVGTQVELGRGLNVVIGSDGAVTASTNGRFDQIALTAMISETAIYTLRDPAGQLSDATIKFVIEGENDAPVAVDDSAEIDRDTELRLSVDRLLANDRDVDGDQIRVALINDVPATAGQRTKSVLGASIEVSTDGVLIYDPTTSEDVAALPDGATIEDEFSYQTIDPHGAVGSAKVTVRISAPVPSVTVQDDQYELPASAPLQVAADAGLLANDMVVAGQTATVVAVNGATGIVGRPVVTERGAILTVRGDGALVYDPNGAFDELADGELTEETIVYTAADATGGRFSGQVVFSVVGVGAGDGLTTDQSRAISIDILSRVSDPDGDRLSLTRVTPNTTGVSVEINPDGSVTYDPNGRFDHLKRGEEIADSFVYEVSDGRGGMATATVVLKVVGLNDLPTAGTDAAAGFFGQRLEISASDGLLTNDADPDGDRLTIVGLSVRSGGGVQAAVGEPLQLASTATITVDDDGSFSYQAPVLGPLQAANATENLVDSFWYTLSDGQGGSVIGKVTITVAVPNRAPLAPDIGFSNGRPSQRGGG